MKTIVQELPKGQKDIILHALTLRQIQLTKDLEVYEAIDLENIHYELFDINVLKKLLGYKVDIVLNEAQYEHFTTINKVDYPMYDIEPKIIV
jgi:uncharacterized protein YfbU (UPF0304 family)